MTLGAPSTPQSEIIEKEKSTRSVRSVLRVDFNYSNAPGR